MDPLPDPALLSFAPQQHHIRLWEFFILLGFLLDKQPVFPLVHRAMSSSKLSFDVLKIREFRLMLFTRMFSLSALQAQGVIIGWQIYEKTRDPLMLGLTGLAEAVPAIACALFAGYVVDHSRPQ